MTLFIGIDPGLKGGIAVLPGLTGVEPMACPMPLLGGEYNVRGIHDMIARYVGMCSSYETFIAIEKVHSMPKQGISSAFNFGVGYGSLRTIAMVLHSTVILVTPQRWKKTILHDTQMDKDAAIAWAARTWPQVPLVLPRCHKPHDGMADALCIAAYAKHIHHH